MTEWPITDKEAAQRLGYNWRLIRRIVDERGLCFKPDGSNRRKLDEAHFEALKIAISARRVEQKIARPT